MTSEIETAAKDNEQSGRYDWLGQSWVRVKNRPDRRAMTSIKHSTLMCDSDRGELRGNSTYV